MIVAVRHGLLLFMVVLGVLCCYSAEVPKMGLREWLGPLAPFVPHTAVEEGSSLTEKELIELAQHFAATRKRQGNGEVKENLTPVVLVASLIGSKLQAQLDGFKSSHLWCFSEWQDWFTTWVSELEFVPLIVSCWAEQVALQFDPATGSSSNTPGVNMRYVDYGGVSGLTYLDDWNYIGVWNTTVFLLESLGYEVGKNLRGAPYDFRFGPDMYEKEDWPRLRALIEETYEINNQSKVSAVSLSMGSPYFLAFLNTVDQEWKDKYIHSFVSFDGAFGGSPSSLMSLITKSSFWYEQFGSSVASILPDVIRSWPSIAWLLPTSQVYGDAVWVSTTNPPRNYTAADWIQLMNDVGAPTTGAIVRSLQGGKWYDMDAPGVETHAFFGTGTPTAAHATFKDASSFDDKPVSEYADGDGTVLVTGLRMLEQFRDKQTQPIYSYPIQGLYHGASVQNKQVLRMYLEVLFSH